MAATRSVVAIASPPDVAKQKAWAGAHAFVRMEQNAPGVYLPFARSGRVPLGVAAGLGDRPVEQRSVLGHGVGEGEAGLAGLVGERGEEAEDPFELGVGGLVGLAGGSGEVPAVDH